MRRNGMEIDARRFLKGLSLADRRVMLGARRGVAKILAEWEKRAKRLAPVDQSGRKPGGTLAASITAHVDDIEAGPNRVQGKISAGGGEAADYAIRQHEATLRHTHPTSGVYASKYIEQPAKELDSVAGRTVADEIKRQLG